MPRIAPRWVRLQSDPILYELDAYAKRLKVIAKLRGYDREHPVVVTHVHLADYVKRALTGPRRLDR